MDLIGFNLTLSSDSDQFSFVRYHISISVYTFHALIKISLKRTTKIEEYENKSPSI